MSKKTNWFEERELPDILNNLDLLKAFSIVKNRFNGNPHCYTRNDYILFINTIYAAFRDLYYSTHLQDDLTTECLVGYVKKGHTFKKGDSLYSVLELIFTGEGDVPDIPVEPDNPTSTGFYTNLIKPIGRDYFTEDLEAKSNLKEGDPFFFLQYSSSELATTDILFDKTDWAILPGNEFRVDKLQIVSPKPLDLFVNKITKHITSNWTEDPLCSTVDLNLFEFQGMVTIQNSEWYKYELNEDKLPFSLQYDVLIKFIFK